MGETVMCRCGHDHYVGENRWVICTANGCDCRGFEAAPAQLTAATEGDAKPKCTFHVNLQSDGLGNIKCVECGEKLILTHSPSIPAPASQPSRPEHAALPEEVITRKAAFYIGNNDANPRSHIFDIKLRRMDAFGNEWRLDAEVQLEELKQSHAELEEKIARISTPFSYSEGEQSHELSKSQFKDGVDELIHCVDSANRYLNRRLIVEQNRAALDTARKLEVPRG